MQKRAGQRQLKGGKKLLAVKSRYSRRQGEVTNIHIFKFLSLMTRENKIIIDDQCATFASGSY